MLISTASIFKPSTFSHVLSREKLPGKLPTWSTFSFFPRSWTLLATLDRLTFENRALQLKLDLPSPEPSVIRHKVASWMLCLSLMRCSFSRHEMNRTLPLGLDPSVRQCAG